MTGAQRAAVLIPASMVRPLTRQLTAGCPGAAAHPELEQAARGSLEHLGDDDSMMSIAVLADAATGFMVSGNVDQGVESGRRVVDAATARPFTPGRKRMFSPAELLPAQHSEARDLAENIRAALAA